MDYWINIYNQLLNRSPQLRANSWPKWRFWRKKCPWKRTQSSVDGWLKIGWRNVVNFPPSPSSRSLGTVPNSQSRSPGTRVDIFNVHAIYHLDPFMHEHSLIYIWHTLFKHNYLHTWFVIPILSIYFFPFIHPETLAIWLSNIGVLCDLGGVNFAKAGRHWKAPGSHWIGRPLAWTKPIVLT